MITGNIHEIPTPLPDLPIHSVNSLNALWMHNAYMLGYFCLGVGFVIGLIAGYYYCKGKYDD